jgi:hypothetical protein
VQHRLHLTCIGAVQPEIREQHNHVVRLLSWSARRDFTVRASWTAAAEIVDRSAYDLRPIRSRMSRRPQAGPAGQRRPTLRHAVG